MISFKEKVIWITGASSGIGEHLAYTLSEMGAKLVLSSRNEQELSRVRQNCRRDSDILVLPLDVTDYPRIPEATNRVTETFGFINILINNAGVSQRALAQDTSFEVDKQILETNYLGTVALTKAVLPVFLRQQFGHIVVISSVLGKVSIPYRSAYCASKHALHGFFDSLRAEVKEDNIKVTLICPGYVETNLPINALRGDGSRNSTTANTSRNGIDPAIFAQKAANVIAAEKKEVYIGGKKEVLAVYIRRFLPWLFDIIATKLRKTKM